MGGPLSSPRDAWLAELDDLDRRPKAANPWGARSRFLALAIAALALSTYPPVSMPLGCVVLGWDDLLTARWLKRTDPDRVRGRVCSRFYLAFALGRISLIAFAAMFAIIIIHIQMVAGVGDRPDRGNEPPPPPEFIGCGLITTFGLLLSTAVSSLAVVSALRHRVRVWVGPEARWARADDVWPPHFARRRGRSTNRTRIILIGTLVVVGVTGLMVVLLSSTFLPTQRVKSPLVPAVVVVLMLLGLPVSILVLLEWLSARIMAPTPSACWSHAGEVDRPRG